MPLPLLYGALIGLAQLFATLVVFALGKHQTAEGMASAQMPESLIGFILLMVVVSFAHRSAKKTISQGGPLPFGAGAKFAVATGLVGGIVTAIGQYLYLAFINPSLRTLQQGLIVERAKDQLAKLSPEEAAQVMQKIEYATSATARGVVYGVNTFLFATLLGIAFAMIFRASVRRDLQYKPSA
ncbi:MAG: DUF4199 domain-containing protein [Verrucomicrobia bacterium]|nr:DUF4199 domain-containing protein [Verrucomicrobiota bacterium]